MAMDVRAVQRRLKEEGFDPGKIDGVIGRDTTTAIAAYQKAKNLPIKYPGTLGSITLGSLFGAAAETGLTQTAIMRPWYDLAIRKKGLHEKRDNADLVKFLRSDGKTLGDPAKLPWCGDFIETCIALTLPREPLPTNPYLARNWMKFGVDCQPQLGSILVFWRGKKSGTSGHVAFCAGAGKGVLYCLGGNQSDSISVTPIAVDRLLGSRWPSTVMLPPTLILPKMVGGKLSTNEA